MKGIPILALSCWALLPAIAPAAETVRVGAKNFTEQQVLGELVAQLLEAHTDLRVERRFGLGGTGLIHAALVTGELDLYVEYTGTALVDLLRLPVHTDPHETYRIVAGAYRRQFDLAWLPPIGFNNTYAFAVREEDAQVKGWTTVSDLVEEAASLRAGFPSEFLERPDGYPGLQNTYGLAFGRIIEMDPGLMYNALIGGQVDVISAFATDGRLAAYPIHVLEDDRGALPPYHAAPVIRQALLDTYPEIRDALVPLAGTISDEAMRELNDAVDGRRMSPQQVARDWVARHAPPSGVVTQIADVAHVRPSFWRVAVDRRSEVLSKVGEHVALSGLAMGIAILAGVPLGIVIQRRKRMAAGVLGMAEVVQTIPSLAMLAFLFSLYQVLGLLPAVTALLLYALLPIVLNTFTGLRQVAPELIEAADGLGMSSRQRLWMVELPLAMPVIVAGVRTATVWTIGIATLSTYIGAGGLGDFISRGLARNDPQLTLLGALPAALLAVLASLLIRAIEIRLRKS